MNVLLDPPKPRLRGRLHQIAFFFAVPAGLLLVAIGPTPAARAACAVYAGTLIALFGVSASYHRYPWKPEARAWMRRFDHSTIFVFIAGTYTPLAVLVLDGAWRIAILWAVWTAAVLGVVLKMIRLRLASRAGPAMYVALGWAAVIALPRLIDKMSAPEIALLLLGGVFHTTGAVIYARRRPDPNPQVFGYHEIYHALVIVAVACHYAVIFSVARAST